MAGRRLALLFLVFSLSVAVAACGGDESAFDAVRSSTAGSTTGVEATSTSEPTTTPPTATTPAVSTTLPSAVTPSAQSTTGLSPNGDRIAGYVIDLAQNIGIRAAGSPNEKAAADYLAAKLTSFGYSVQLQDFAISNDSSRQSTLSISSSSVEEVDSVPFAGSAAGQAQGTLVAVSGLGGPADFSAGVRGSIALIERGTVLFRDKIANAAAAGAIGVIIFNNESGAFYGEIGGTSAIPAVGISQSEGHRLRDLVSRGTVTVDLDVEVLTQKLSHNVIAKPPGRECETVSGGHYDSVPAGPGANDNASGTATVVELAAVVASRGQMGGNCFVLFGAEEIGLEGSRAYVDSLSQAEKNRIRAMLNFDMVGFRTEPWLLIGSSSLQDKAASVATALTMPFTRSRSHSNDSDHASFINAGIPALFLYGGADPEWHQPGDLAPRIQPEALEAAARFGVAMLESLASGG